MAPSATQDHTYQAHAARHLSRHERDRLAPSSSLTYATAAGNPVPQHHPYAAQRAGENGPLLLQQDFHHLELLQHFDRERIPERVVHAKGGGAHGYFECADPAASDITAASLFAEPGKRCPVTVRFSTVGGESGSHDCARDPRGFSVKFRTDEGIWDIVANNTPVFFLRDPVKFPHFIHTQKRDPKTHLTHADDATHFWEYLSQNPESVHQVMILMGDRGIPDGWRFMHGYYGHSLKLVDARGEWVYCQLHIKSLQGTKFLTQDEAAACGPDYAQKDLYEAIERGDFPRWSLEAQIMTPAEAERAWEEQGINVLDLTHVWPQGQFPRRKLGEIVLDQNVENHFAEVEQAAFNPAHMPPGVQPSADPVLQSRLFSYGDTHCHRLGANHKQLPVNSPSSAADNSSIGNFQRDGKMALFNQGSRPNYLSSLDPIALPARRATDLDRVHAHFLSDAVTFLSAIWPEDFRAPRALWQKVWDEPARERFVHNVAHKFGCCPAEEPLRRQVAIFREVDADMAARVEKATGIKGYDGIADMQFNGTYNGMAKDEGKRAAAGFTKAARYQGAPKRGTHEAVGAAMNGH